MTAVPVDQRGRVRTKPPEPEQDATVVLPTIEDVFAATATGQPRWQRQALCASGEHDPELWWPQRGDHGLQAREICAGCPVLGDCPDRFLTTRGLDRSGIWAGVSGYRLAAAAQKLRHPERTHPERHGLDSGGREVTSAKRIRVVERGDGGRER